MRADSLVAGKPRVWAANVSGAGGFDVSPDGKRIAILLPASASESRGRITPSCCCRISSTSCAGVRPRGGDRS